MKVLIKNERFCLNIEFCILKFADNKASNKTKTFKTFRSFREFSVIRRVYVNIIPKKEMKTLKTFTIKNQSHFSLFLKSNLSELLPFGYLSLEMTVM